MNSERIVITGFMASGKTAVAQALGRILNCRAIDLDERIAARVERTPKEIIEQDGEPVFREIETRLLREVLQDPEARVIALGGGAWTLRRNRELIAQHHGFTVWLDVPFELCWQRMTESGSERPLARDRASALDLYNQRRPVYELTSLCISVSAERHIDDLAAEISQAILQRIRT